MKMLQVAAALLLTFSSAPARGVEAVDSQTAVQVQPAPEPLSLEEEQELSARAEAAGPEIRGGALSNLHLTYIVIALAAAVLVLVLK